MNDTQTELVNMPLWGWVAFNAFVIVMIVMDLVVFHRKTKTISFKEALMTSALWIMMALIFNLGISYFYGKNAALDFLTSYLIEKSLSVDNLFVFIMIFQYFRTPREYHHTVLFYGILGAILMRALFIFVGISLVDKFHWIMYVFGAFLIYTAIKMAMPKINEINPEQNFVIRWFKKFIPVTEHYEGDKFFIKKDSRWWATPLFIVVLTVEMTDVIFAVDSIPAVMAITLDPFIVYTSNIFAILGLRALYFALANFMPLFHFLKYGLAAILGFVGFKMLFEPFIEIPIIASLGFIIAAITFSVGASLLFPEKR